MCIFAYSQILRVNGFPLFILSFITINASNFIPRKAASFLLYSCDTWLPKASPMCCVKKNESQWILNGDLRSDLDPHHDFDKYHSQEGKNQYIKHANNFYRSFLQMHQKVVVFHWTEIITDVLILNLTVPLTVNADDYSK